MRRILCLLRRNAFLYTLADLWSLDVVLDEPDVCFISFTERNNKDYALYCTINIALLSIRLIITRARVLV